ncbi:glycoside hydrolase family 10 protein [Catalinimonas niigatensis]|uniref:glycoside hydrolase family 10 protein n=1 Tax=Catalinimonas niigatensis TaxID=1397264 RepID=UPI002666AE86|nr:family 10 glycosylhydrolase [Catalinimonas niigatensis]WPP50496.1 family 10 glycosylhydrolase [Catalinimonas niigatensis]
MKIIFRILLFLSIFLSFSVTSQAQDHPLKREFRGVWITSMNNVDWPTIQGLTSEEQQEEFRSLLTMHRKNGFNAVLVQIRPSADVLYDSPYEPWSRWLSGKEGNKPNPFYDPLTFMIKECHQQGMEFHAWINPFRAIYDFKNVEMDPGHLFYKNPQWLLTYGKHIYLDPGMAQARAYVLKVVMDIVNRYEVDGIHFDDYFYPYHVDSLAFPDDTTFKLYGEGFEDKREWRRQNINLFVKAVYDSMQAVKPEVKFGISPFGVWHNSNPDTLDSLTQVGPANYEDLFADVITWLQNGWVDYVVPIIDFGVDSSSVEYQDLLSRWSQNTYGKQLYIGQAAYKIHHEQDSLRLGATQLPELIRTHWKNFQVDGQVYYSARPPMQSPALNHDVSQYNYYPYDALIPAMTWKPGQTPDPPSDLKVARHKHDVLVQWESNIHQPAHYYVVYLQQGDTAPNISNSKYILGKTSEKRFSFSEKGTGLLRKKYCLVVTAVDQQHRESLPSHPVMIRLYDY